MLPVLDGNYLLALPLPLADPGPQARLAALAVLRVDAALRAVGPGELIRCKLPARVLPRPGYLFSQSLDPTALAQGLTELEFVERLQSLLTAPDTTVITWSARHLQGLLAAQLRLWRKPDLLSRIPALCDLFEITKTVAVLGPQSHPWQSGLVAAAAGFGHKAPHSPPTWQERLELMRMLLETISQNHAPILNFQLQPQQERRLRIRKALEQGSMLAGLGPKAQIRVLKPLCLSQDILKARVYEEGELSVQALPLCECALLAPVGILTEARQQALGFDLKEAQRALVQSGSQEEAEVKSLVPWWQGLERGYSKADYEWLESREGAPLQSYESPALGCTKALGDDYLRCLGDNCPGSMIDEDYRAYLELSRSEVSAGIKSYLTECAALLNHADENDARQSELLRRIRDYPLTL